MTTRLVFWVCAIAACGYISYQSAIALLEVPVINDEDKVSNSGNNLSVNDSSLDMFATKMKFKQNEDVKTSEFYELKEYAFVVSNISRICPEQNCKFELEDFSLSSDIGKSDYVIIGKMKIDIGDVKRIIKIFSRFEPTEEREKDGQIIETVDGNFEIGKDPVIKAEHTYNINGTLVTDGKDRTLSLQAVQCNSRYDDPTKKIDCNYRT